ncbi:hypothetical protein HAX54_043624, partial [Datura stramonium]|nr:hypothetical protein [Datura stramonium]
MDSLTNSGLLNDPFYTQHQSSRISDSTNILQHTPTTTASPTELLTDGDILQSVDDRPDGESIETIEQTDTSPLISYQPQSNIE